MPQTRKEHVDWCKKRALEYLEAGDLPGAFSSMISDLGKDEATASMASGALGLLMATDGMMQVMANDARGLRHWIEGFN